MIDNRTKDTCKRIILKAVKECHASEWATYQELMEVLINICGELALAEQLAHRSASECLCLADGHSELYPAYKLKSSPE